MEMIALGIAGSMVVGIVGLFAMGGTPARLDKAKVGEVYTFTYLQPKDGVHKRHLVKVLDCNKLSKEGIDKLNATSKYRRDDNTFMRTGSLVTAQDKHGNIRNFYAERAIDCKKSWTAKLAYNFGVL